MPREGEGGRIGADYCYNPSPDDDTDSSDGGNGGDGGTTSPLPVPLSMRWLRSKGCTPTRPCGACSGNCDEDEDCLDEHSCFKRLVGDCYVLSTLVLIFSYMSR